MPIHAPIAARPSRVGAINGPIRSRHGLILLPDRIQGGAHPPDRVLPEFDATPSAQVLDKTLADIAGAYGQSTTHYVAVELEYPQPLK